MSYFLFPILTGLIIWVDQLVYLAGIKQFILNLQNAVSYYTDDIFVFPEVCGDTNYLTA